MKKYFSAIFLFISISLFSFLSLADVAPPPNNDAVAFAKTAYESMIAIDPKSTEFSRTALDKFKGIFGFDAFANRCLTDIAPSFKPEENSSFITLFNEVFFLNFEKKTNNILARKLDHPAYTLKTTDTVLTIVTATGQTPKGTVTLGFYLSKDASGSWKLVDLEIDDVLLSRNYRGSFNKIHREKGHAGLIEKLTNRKTELLKLK